MKRVYSYIFAKEDTHEPITSIRQMRLKKFRWSHSFGFFCNGVAIGHADLSFRERLGKDSLHTTYVGLDDKYRRKGHGIHLYKALIECAQKLGAKRIYSDSTLNKFSRRMWKIKLPKAGFEVKEISKCKNACKHCQKNSRFYIDLGDKK